MHQMMYNGSVEIQVPGEKTGIPQDTGQVTKKCTFFTEIPPSLGIAQPEHADFKLEDGGLGGVGCFLFLTTVTFFKRTF